MSNYLPIDVLVEILCRLPVKSLLRFTCVCKRWYSLILNPNFISKHMNSQSVSNSEDGRDHFLLVRHYDAISKIERFALHFENDSFDAYEELQCPFPRVNDYFKIVGSCNGLICLADDHDANTDMIIIWNPCARRAVNLPKPVFSTRLLGTALLGFGFDDMNNDYKVLRIVYHLNIPGDHHYSIPPNVEVYALSTGAWKNICDVAPRYDIFGCFQSPAFTHGSVHWVGSRRGVDGHFHNFVSAFDISAEVFREVMIPDSLAEAEVLKLSILAWGPSLALVQYEKIWQSEYCWVWVMEEYGGVGSWARLFMIDMRDGLRKVVGLQKNNEVLLSAKGKGLVSYHPWTQRTKCLGIRGDTHSLYVDSFTESLVLVKGGNRALELGNSSGVVADGMGSL